MIHLPPLPGSPGYAGFILEDYIKFALSEADKLSRAGFDGFIVENYMDYPFSVVLENDRALEVFANVVESLRNNFSNMMLGVNVLRNSGVEAVEIACKHGADFIRVNAYYEPIYSPEGFLKPLAREIWNRIRAMNCRVKIYADVNVKHSKPIIYYTTALYETCGRGRVSGVIVTGRATGFETPVDKVYVARMICRDHEIWIGSGVNISNIGSYIDLADAVIVGTSIKEGNKTENPIDYNKARSLVEKTKILEKRVLKTMYKR